MSKIVGATVGTPTSPSRMKDEIKPVLSVNGKKPDENGNVEVEGGGSGGVEFTTDEEVNAILEKVYGGSSDDIPEEDVPLTDDDFATDAEVSDMLEDVFGSSGL